MSWQENEKTKSFVDSDAHNARMSELALDALTCATLHLKSVARFQKAITDLSASEQDADLRATVVAWEKASATTLDMTRKSLEEMYSIDPKFGSMIDSRWKDMTDLIESTIPMVRVMVDAELAAVPPIYKFVRDLKKEGCTDE